MQQQPGKGTDVIQEILEDSLMAFPVSSLLISFYKQYQQRGFLTKKQLQGLYSKASSIPDINPGRLATLEAIIKKLPNRFKSEATEIATEAEKNEEAGRMIDEILAKYPQHKRLLFLKAKYENNELSAAEEEEVKKFRKLLLK
jgi:hypothetical protein